MWLNDYYPFGMLKPGRYFNPDDYNHGFNGMRADDELKGTGNSYDFGARIYDPRLGRFLSVDPLIGSFPHLSSYLYANNSPIYFIDRNGKNAEGYIGDDGKLYITATYHAVTEGKYSYTEVEMKQIESTLNNFWSQAQGMEVTLSDGRSVEIGGVEFNVKPGGDFHSAEEAALSSRENFLYKATSDVIKDMSESERTEAISFNTGGSETLNFTLLDKDKVGKFSVGKEFKNMMNAIIDEGGHMLGTRHPEERKEGESRKEYNQRKQQYGDLEKGKKHPTGVLKLSPKDLQNIVNSDEFQMRSGDD